MRPATLEFLRQRFLRYYQTGHLIVPPALEEREWGFIFFDPSYPEIRMCRHLAFGGKREIIDYLRGMVPAHAFYSCAYYASPSAPTMAEKSWNGADLIFDLDADHIARGPYHLMLERVKEETEKLISMLTAELGFDERSIEVVFSGGRGYHLHIRDLAVRGWGSQERREIIDYVCGIGINPRSLLAPDHYPTTGWSPRYRDALVSYLRWLGTLSREEAVGKIATLEGVGTRAASTFIERLPVILSMLHEQTTGPLLKNRIMRVVLSESNEEFSKRLRERAALADEPVTTDIKRLIRMPSSLHGGSGLRVTPLTVRDLHSFDPLIDAVIFGDREVSVEPQGDLTMQLLGNTYKVTKGKISTVPEALAVFLCCRGVGEIAGGS